MHTLVFAWIIGPSRNEYHLIWTIGTHATQKKMHPHNAQQFFKSIWRPTRDNSLLQAPSTQLTTQILPAQITWILTNRFWSWVILTMRTGSALPVYLTNVHICCSTWARFCQRNIKSLAPHIEHLRRILQSLNIESSPWRNGQIKWRWNERRGTKWRQHGRADDSQRETRGLGCSVKMRTHIWPRGKVSQK